MTPTHTLTLGLALSHILAGVALAQPIPSGASLPPGVYVAEKDIALATAGTYGLDSKHASVIAKVSHLGYSWSVFRFNDVEGTLVFDPAAIEKSKLNVSVDTASIDTNVAGFAEELAGDQFLKSKTYPKATFVSTAFRRDGDHGQVDGQFTLMGKTQPLTFDVDLAGVGKGFGSPRIGVEARAKINPTDFGISPMLAGPVELVINVEFSRRP